MTASTLLLIAYRKSTISLADRAVFLDHGRVADAGTHEELRGRSQGYRALVDAYDEAAISHNLLESSGPQPSHGPAPSIAAPAARTSSSALGAEATAEESALHTVRRGLALTPNALQGLWITILLAVIATAGKVVVPIAVQSILDRGIIEPATPDLAFVS